MKHRIRINGEVKEIDCEWGSGILDKHGREIFEGDKIKIVSQDDNKVSMKIVYKNGALAGKRKTRTLAEPLIMLVPFVAFNDKTFEIVDD